MQPWLVMTGFGLSVFVIFFIFRTFGRSKKTDEFVRVAPQQNVDQKTEGETDNAS